MRSLITMRHWQKFTTFQAQFQRAAQQLAAQHDEPDLGKITVSARQFERWYAGRVKTAPHPDACRVLEHMFGYGVHDLLGAAGQITQRPEKGFPGKGQASGNSGTNFTPEAFGLTRGSPLLCEVTFNYGNPVSISGDPAFSDPGR